MFFDHCIFYISYIFIYYCLIEHIGDVSPENYITLSFHSSGILSFSHIMPINIWILFITSCPPCLRSSAGMLSVHGALLLLSFSMASWVSCFVGACFPSSPFCVFFWFTRLSVHLILFSGLS